MKNAISLAMSALLTLTMVALLIESASAGTSTLITKQQAEQDALMAVGGGTLTQVLKEKELGRIIWSVDVTGATHEYEVWVDAHDNAILQILTQPLTAQVGFITKQRAEQVALARVGGGTVVQAQRDQWKGYQIWDITITKPGFEFEVFVNARNATILQVSKQVNTSTVSPYITKARAEQIALAAVGGGSILLIRLETNDSPVDWSVDVRSSNHKEYEVKINAVTGKIIAIIVGG